jgi:RNA polymerase sigma factor (sigma-70 family)
MVLGVCRRVLPDRHLAEDAFQATFLVLVRKASSLKHRERVGGWLHGVAWRVARKAKVSMTRRREQLQDMTDLPTPGESEAADWRDLNAVLDQEIERLPDKYREPIVMTYLEGKTNSQVAKELGCPEGTVFGRLARAREKLRFRLVRRGVVLSGAAISGLLTSPDLAVALPAALTGTILKAAALASKSGAALAGGFSARVTALADGTLRDMFLSRVGVGILVVLSVGFLGLGTAIVHYVVSAGNNPDSLVAGAISRLEDCAPDPVRGLEPLPAGVISRIGTTRFRFVGSIQRIAYSPDGRLLAAAGTSTQLDSVIVIWDAKSGKRLHQFHQENFFKRTTGQDGNPDNIAALAFAPNGKMLAWAVQSTDSPTVYLWDSATGKEVHALSECRAPLAFTPDSKLLAGSGKDGKVRFWSTATGTVQTALAGSAGPVAIRGDGKVLATGGQDRHIHIWELPSGKEVLKLAVGMKNHNGKASMFQGSFVFAPRGPLLAVRWGVRSALNRGAMGTFYDSVTVQVWNTSTSKQVLNLDEGKAHSGGAPITFLAFAPEGDTLYSQGVGEQVVHALEVTTELRERPAELRRITGITHPGCVLSPGGRILASWEGRTLRFWETATGKEKDLGFEGHSDSVYQLAIAADGKTLVSLSADSTVGLWDLTSGKEIRRLRPYLGFSLALEGKALLLNRGDGFSSLDLATGKELHPDGEDVLAKAAAQRNFDVSPDGKKFAWMAGGQIRVADLVTNKELASFEDTIVPRGLAFSADGKLLAQVKEEVRGRGQCRVYVWELATHKLLQTFPSPSGLLSWPRVKFLATGGILLTEDDAGIRFWDLVNGKEVQQIAARRWTGFSSDGRLIATGNSNTLYVQETASTKELFRLRAPRGWATLVAFSPDGKALAVADEDGAIRLLETATGKERRTLRGHQARILALTFSKDGIALASGSADTTIIIWDVKEK